MLWNDGILECWNNGLRRMRSFYDTLGKSEIKIKIISVYSSMTAFGKDGPYKDKPGFELIIQALTGLVDVTTPAEGTPAKIQIQVVDLCTGMVKTIIHPQAGDIKLLDKPWHLSASSGGLRMPPPVLGQHTDEVLLAHGFSGSEIAQLKQLEVVFGP
jgi:crotonobetainyl-CoA:carnitine CoA-transferase CaiB-like acyl-CoA transferase